MCRTCGPWTDASWKTVTMSAFTPETLPAAISRLFRLNHYAVDGPTKVNGAEIDLVATPLGNPFAPKVYLEATVEYVNNAKYGKDMTKLAMVRAMDPGSACLIVSSSGFTEDVRERARATRIETLTFQELFARFEKFQPYLELMTGESEAGKSLSRLAEVYERPRLDDSHGVDDALSWMDSWLADPDRSKSWLIIVGEYGTGKSALTRMLLKSWLETYANDPGAPIPIRIELGNFTKQFDAQGLLHHFLDHNGLGHVPIDFFWSLIRARRIVLLLDGYDEMAQYLTQRERRSTLKALAELSSDGARGLLTSRPNYFSETEELTLFDHLYREMSVRSRYAESAGEEIRRRESEVDELIQRSILDRYERSLRDLSPEQARQLVRTTLRESPDAADTVVNVLDRVFRATGDGAEVALSGKPVIISYLIQVASTLPRGTYEKLTEWDVYTLIVDQLALRDLEQTARVSVEERRSFLQALAGELTKSGATQVSEERFRALVEREFQGQLRRLSGAKRTSEIDGLFEDLRRSGTLTRSSDGVESGWRFSHNSLREFLVAERMLDDLESGATLKEDPPVSDAMRAFVISRGQSADELIPSLTRAWDDVVSNPAVGSYLTLVWDVIARDSPLSAIERIAGSPPNAYGVGLTSLDISDENTPGALSGAAFRNCTLIEVSLRSADLTGASFKGSLFEAVSFDEADLTDADFTDCMLVDVSMVGAKLNGATFTGINHDVSLIIEGAAGRERIEGSRARGYIAYHGGLVDDLNDYFKWMNHPRFTILQKISGKLLEGGLRQRRGLVQRGAAALDPAFSRRFVKTLESLNYIRVPLGRPDLVEITSQGRAVLGAFRLYEKLSREIVAFLETNQ